MCEDQNEAHISSHRVSNFAYLMSMHGMQNVSEIMHDTISEIKMECTPDLSGVGRGVYKHAKKIDKFLFIPYFPALYRPGWLKSYIMGPHTFELFECIMCDMWAGLIVALTLLPQGLSYAQLANVPAINGLYSAVLPSAAYTFLGSSMQLAVGPVAIVSLLTGQLVAKYLPSYATETERAMGLAQQLSMICGVYLILLGLFKAGNLIRFISHSVMSGFTSAAAMLIGLSQIKNAFGFPRIAPQTGMPGYHYNYEVMEWFAHNWYASDPKTGLRYVNHYATKITFGIYIPLILTWALKQNVKSTPERKKTWWFRIFTYGTNILPLFAIIIGASVAQSIIDNAGDDDLYAKNLKVIGNLPAGLDILKQSPYEFSWTTLLPDMIPLTLISFMESYSVARRIATQRNELHILNANQELFSLGVANCLGGMASAIPVSGSFSRSSLNAMSGARTPFSKATTMILICISLLCLTTQFYYIPNAALSAIIWVAITSLISPSDLWEAWKHSKKDFVVMFMTFAVTLIWNTEYGLAVGIAASVGALLVDLYFHRTIIDSFLPEDEKTVVLEHYENLTSLKEVEYIRLHTDVNFVTVPRVKDYIVDEVLDQKAEVITSILLDFADVHVTDLTGLLNLREIADYTHAKGVLFGAINMSPAVEASLQKFGIPLDSYTSLKEALTKNPDLKIKSPDSDSDSAALEEGPTVRSKAADLENERNHLGLKSDASDRPLPSPSPSPRCEGDMLHRRHSKQTEDIHHHHDYSAL